MSSQIKSKKRVRDFAEVFTAEREVKAMCDLIPQKVWYNIESTFLEPTCVDSDTEYFNGLCWKSIKEYKEGENVLCYNEKDGSAFLDKPLKYIKSQCDEMFILWSSPKLNMCLSKDHSVIYLDYKNRIKRKTAEEVYKKYYVDSNGFRGKIPITFNFNGNLVLNEWQLRLAVACNADGRIIGKYRQTYQIRVKKQRKYERLVKILEKCGFDYKYKIYDGYHDFTFVSPLGCKLFSKDWINLTHKCKEIFIDEIQYWDGYKDKYNSIQYSSSKKEDIDLVQFIACSIGYSTNVFYDKRGRKTNYVLTITRCKTAALDRRHKDYFQKIESQDGFKYCFSVSSGALVLRRKDKIFVTGNCGTGNFLVEIYSRKLERCKDERDGLKALASIVGLDIQEDNVIESRNRLKEMYLAKFPNANGNCLVLLATILLNNIRCCDSLEQMQKWIDEANEKAK